MKMPSFGKARGGHWLRRILRLFLTVYLGVCLVLAWLQTKMIFPGHDTQGNPRAVVRPEEGTELVPLTTKAGARIFALFGAALDLDGQTLSDPASRPSMIFFYGNAMCLHDAAIFDLDRFRRLGVNVLIPEYVGYGMSEGVPSEQALYDTALTAYDYLVTRNEVNRRRIIAVGWSLGGAVATELASRRPVAGLAVFSTFTSLPAMARRLFPYLPASLLLRHRFETLDKFRKLRCPILIGHSRTDEVVPFAMSAELAQATPAPITRLILDRAEHGAFFEKGGSKVFGTLGNFIQRVSATTLAPANEPSHAWK